MGYGMGKDDALARRKARLAARYGTRAVLDASALEEFPPVGLPVGTAQAPSIDPPKKKGGRPKGSKNKRAE